MGIECENMKIFTWRLTGVNCLCFLGLKVVTLGLINWSFSKMVKDEPLDYKKYKILNDLVMSAKLP